MPNPQDPSDPLCFDSCRAAITALLELDPRTEVVEHTIEAYPLDREAKDALWLWAVGRRTGAARSSVGFRSLPDTSRPRMASYGRREGGDG
jgi:hypothetical protein